jgi:erythromycin esterase
MTTDTSLEHFVEWAKGHAASINVDAPLDDVRDLAPFKSIIGHARVVGFGESQHHIAEFSEMRARLFRYLVEEMDFTTFVFECGVIEAKAAHDFVLGLHDDADAAFVPLESGFNLWRGLQDLVHWMRDYNRAAGDARKLKFYGMDGSRRWVSTRRAVAFVCDYLDQVNPDHGRAVRHDLLPLAETIHLKDIGEASAEAIRALVHGLADLVGHLEIEKLPYIDRSTADEFDWAHRAALIARQIGVILSAAHTDPANAQRYRWNIRDIGMATELDWIRRREGPDGRLLVGAHNVHFQKAYAGGVRPTAGQHLALAMAPEDLVMIAATNDYSLKPDDPAIEGSFQSALALIGMPSFVLDLRAAAGDAQAAAWLDQERPDRNNVGFTPLNAAQAWDAVYFTRRVSIDTLSLPGPFERTYVELEAGCLDGLDGVYDITGIGDRRVVLRIFRDGDRLLTDGADSDGELFPMHRSELFALSDTHFAWREWGFEVEFERDAEGIAHGLNIHPPKALDNFHGVKRLMDQTLHDDVVRHGAQNRFPFPDQTDWPADYVTIVNVPEPSSVVETPEGSFYPDIVIRDGTGACREACEVELEVEESASARWRAISQACTPSKSTGVQSFFVYVPEGREAEAVAILDRNAISFAGVRGFRKESDGGVAIIPYETRGDRKDHQ